MELLCTGETIGDHVFVLERDPADLTHTNENLSIEIGLEVTDLDVSAALGQLSLEVQGDDLAKQIVVDTDLGDGLTNISQIQILISESPSRRILETPARAAATMGVST